MSQRIKIEKNTLASTGIWKTIYESCDYATYFHSPEFSRLMIGYTAQAKIDTRLIEFSDQKKAIFILFKETSFKGLLTNYVSSISGVYGGWISADELTKAHTDLLTDWMQQINLYMRINPYQPNFYNKLKTQPDFTLRLNLQSDFESIQKKYEYRHRHAVKKAIEKGVTIVRAETLAQWKDYYEVYLDSIRRWGDKTRSVYKWPLFESFFNEKSGSINLHLAMFDYKVVAGAICFSSNKKVLYWHGSYLDEYKNVNPVTYLIADVIKTSVGKYDYFDFLPSAGLEGVLFFKKGYGPEEIQTPTFTNYMPRYKLSDKFLDVIRKFLQIIRSK